jgi:hypothetical protein
MSRRKIITKKAALAGVARFFEAVNNPDFQGFKGQDEKEIQKSFLEWLNKHYAVYFEFLGAGVDTMYGWNTNWYDPKKDK